MAGMGFASFYSESPMWASPTENGSSRSRGGHDQEEKKDATIWWFDPLAIPETASNAHSMELVFPGGSE